jgi:RNA recognition motif-containing protein
MSTEEKAEKEIRTIFVGNLPIECIEKVILTPFRIVPCKQDI